MKKAGDLLSAFLDDGLMKKAHSYSGLFSSWEIITKDAAIPAAAAHSRIVELERRVILAEADHPGWIQLLQTKQSQLLKAARRRFPSLVISGISFRLCRDPDAFAQPCPADSSGLDNGISANCGPAGDSQAVNAPVENGATEAVGPDSPSLAADSGNGTNQGGNEDPYSRIHDEEFKNTLKQLEKSINKRNNNP